MNMGINVKLLKDVAVIIETLERLGVGVERTKTMFPSAYLMKYKDDFRIMHFKEMLALDGNEVNLSEEDFQRRDSIIQLLVKWGLVKVEDNLREDTVFIYVLPYTEKVEWKINHKYRRNFKVVE
jgi:hypothetical protein